MLLWAGAAVWADPPKPPPAGTRFPATGQTTSYVAGDDGAVQAGSPLSYTDNGDGTITDKNTKLIWEKKDEAGALHDVRNSYPWTGSGNIFDWVAQLNTEGFAGQTDWRIPNYKELESIKDLAAFNPTVATAFNTNCSIGCTVDGAGNTTECSCTAGNATWSSTTLFVDTSRGWVPDFGTGGVGLDHKVTPRSVRAVRGGP